MKDFWKNLKAWCYKYIGGLFMEQKDGKLVVSIGRVCFMIVFLTMVYFWLIKKVQEGSSLELPDGLFEAFVTLATYVFGTKVAKAMKAWGSKK